VAPTVLAFAAMLGVGGDALLSDGPVGIGLPLWVALLTGSLVALAWRADLEVSREARAWLAAAVVCSSFMAWRDAETLRALNFMGTFGALVVAAAVINTPRSFLFASNLGDLALALLHLGRTAAFGFIPLAFREATAPLDQPHLKTRWSNATRAVLIALPLLIVFGALLRAADPIFASIVSIPAFDGERFIGHVLTVLFLTIAVGGWARAALLPKAGESSATSPARFQLDALEITAGLGTLNVLFAAFLLVQLGWFFGGDEFLRARTGLTAAEYARQGFFQMVVVVALVVPLLVATRALLAPGARLAQRYMVLSLPIVTMLGLIMLSAALRLKMYVGYYGLTADRLYALVFMLWLGVVLTWMSVTVLRGWWRPFLAGIAVSAFATLVGLNVAAPDRIVARVNLARAESTVASRGVDVRYLSQLGGEAVPLAVQAVLSDARPSVNASGSIDRGGRCTAAKTLLARWGATSSRARSREEPQAWRTWNAGEARAVSVVRANATALRQVARDECRRAVIVP
jgi:hypothetical protein